MSGNTPQDDAEWQNRLTPEQYHILREHGTERPFSHPGFPETATRFLCAGCGAEVFKKDAKYESGSGWPSFFTPASPGAVEERTDLSHGMRRTEVLCGSCGSHLGHVFPDGPAPTGLRYCINGLALEGDAGE